MFEDINHSGDGGIYAELVQNRAFQGASTYAPWYGLSGSTLALDTTNPLSTALPTCVVVTPQSNIASAAGLANPGWWGISVTKQIYNGSFYVSGAYNGHFTISLQSNIDGSTWATTSVTHTSTTGQWTQVFYTLKPKTAAPYPNNTLHINFNPQKATDGHLRFNLLSLFPKTYNSRPNGNRPDLMEALAGLNPSFLRAPGGNNIEGGGAAPRWAWNETIGPLVDRPGRLGDWGYGNTDGLGLAEYLNWCVDLGMEPILAVWAGMYLDTNHFLSQANFSWVVNDTMNELEYILGDTSTPFGALRASHGYQEPWTVNYVEIGNEDDGYGAWPSYMSYRFPELYNAIKAKYPNITVIASSPGFDIPAGAMWDYHQYTLPDYWVSEFNLFDSAPAGSMYLLGEYATVLPNAVGGGGVNWGNHAPFFPFPVWVGTVAESIYLLGAERNADRVFGASYAPSLQNLNSYEWSPDLISFTADPSQTVRSTSWSMISLFSQHRIVQTRPFVSNQGFGPVYYVAGSSSSGGFILKTSVYNATAETPMAVEFEGIGAGAKATLTLLTAPGPYSASTIGEDAVLTTVRKLTANAKGVFSFQLPNYSVSVLETH